MSNICPGCGRCRGCGQPAPAPRPYPAPQPGIPISPHGPMQPWREGASPWVQPLKITCHMDGRAISQAILTDL